MPMPTPMSMSEWNEDPSATRHSRQEDEVDAYVWAFERAYADWGGADPAAFLPPSDHPLHSTVLRELVRVDLEYGWDRGCPKELDEYQRSFPVLARDRDAFRDIAFEEFRLRRLAGDDPSPDEYQRRYGVQFDFPSQVYRTATGGVRREGRGHGGADHDSDPLADGEWRLGGFGAPGVAPIPDLPEVGGEFLGFRLVGELGRGSFGRVFLARQGELADRPVVLKVSSDDHDESQALAQLQHENIVPVYSRHRSGGLQAVCMPYLGSVTLRDVLADLKAHGVLPGSGRELLSSLHKSSVKNAAKAGVPESQFGSVHESTRSGEAAPASSRAAAAAAATAGTGSSRKQVRYPGSELATGWALDRGGSGAASGGSSAAHSEAAPAAADSRAGLGALSYVDAVLWMASRLAGGLAHAHDCGILHRDMKPANILLTDDGRPMLLDFNLAEDLKRRPVAAGEKAAVVGTLPYMAPEHLDAFRGGEGSVDARSDLFAFGVIFFEMLTGRPPFPIRDWVRSRALGAMIEDRTAPPPRLRPWNPAVSPAVESIILRCLEPDPARRYQSARELVEDLERHLAHRPLKYAPEPSLRERAAKWLKRHQWAVVIALTLLAVSGLFGGLSTALAARGERIKRFEANETRGRFHIEANEARYLLSAWIGEPEKRREGLDRAHRALAVLHATNETSSPWWESSPVSLLPTIDLGELRSEVGELQLMIAWGKRREGEDLKTPEDRLRWFREAVLASERAERSFLPGRIPQALWIQRSDLLTQLGDSDGARLCGERAKATPPLTARDLYLSGSQLALRGSYRQAVTELERACRLDPENFWAWLNLGISHLYLLEYPKAEKCFSLCIALRPEHPAGWFNRGLAEIQMMDHPAAAADFDKAIELRPSEPEAFINRALVALKQGHPDQAASGFTRALELGPHISRIYFMRATARERAGDREGAQRDRQEGMRREPRDELSFLSRSWARMIAGDNIGALADVDAALALNPSSFVALKNKAHILSERLGKTPEAIAVLDRTLAIFPDNGQLWASRGVLNARLGQRGAALADLDEAMARDPGAATSYFAAGLYAQTSRQVPDDRVEALRMLALALRRGQGLDLIDDDHDLDPVRDDAQFQRIVTAARENQLKTKLPGPPVAPLDEVGRSSSAPKPTGAR
jgi:serine/threonine protein kinase/Tfp pilus assembly protein PilF